MSDQNVAELNHAAATPIPLSKHAPEVSDRLLFSGHVPAPAEVMPITNMGQGLLLASEKKGEFTHERANELLNLPEFIIEGQIVDRNLRDAHVTRLLNAAKRGTFRPEWVSIITCVCLKPCGDQPALTEFRMNGQHTGWMRVYMPKDWSCPVKFLKYEAKTVEDMRILYGSIDRNAPRTNANVINAYLAGLPMFEGVGVHLLRSLSAGIAFWKWEERSTRSGHDADELAYVIKTEYPELMERITRWIVSTPKTKTAEAILYRAPVVGAMFETFAKVPSKAPEFWDVIRDGFGPDVSGTTDPRLRLHNYLRDSTILQTATLGRGKGGKKLVPAEHMYRWCISAWNAWRKGEKVTNLRTTNQRQKAR